MTLIITFDRTLMIYHDIKSSGSNESDKYMTFYNFYNVYLVFTIVYIRMIWCKYRNCPSLCPLFGLCIVLICATQKYRYPTSNSKFHLFDKCWYYQTLHYNFLLERFLSYTRIENLSKGFRLIYLLWQNVWYDGTMPLLQVF